MRNIPKNKIQMSVVLALLICCLYSNPGFAIVAEITNTYPDGNAKEIIYIYDGDGRVTAREAFDEKGNSKIVGIIPDGVIKEYYKGAKLKSEVIFKDNKRNGIAKEYDESGKMKSELKYKENKLNGLSKYYDNGKRVKECDYKDGILISEGMVMNDRLDGIFKQYYDDGKLHEEKYYKDGLLDGVYKEYHKNGKLKTEAYAKGPSYEGLSKSYDENGNLRGESIWKNGKTEGIQKVYRNGIICFETNNKNGKQDGLAKGFYEDGTLGVEQNLKDGMLNGLSTRYYKNGKIMSQEEFKDNIIISSITFDESNKATSNEKFTIENIKYLNIGAFGDIPESVVNFFKAKGYSIPQNWNNKEPNNIIKGNFLGTGDAWAFLVHKENLTNLIILSYNDADKKVIKEDNIFIASTKDEVSFTKVEKNKKAYSLEILKADKDEIIRNNPGLKININKDGIANRIIGKGSSVYYYENGEWQRFQGSK